MRRTPLAVIATLTAVSLTAACSSGDDGSDEPSADGSSSAAASESADPSESASPAFEPAKAKIAPRLLPKVAQPGPKAASADDAQHVVLATLTPAQPTREVVLEQSQKGKWTKLGSSAENSTGDVSFTVEDPEAGALRVVAPKVDGSPQVIGALTDDQVQAGLRDTGFDDAFDGDALGDSWRTVEREYLPKAKRSCTRSAERAAKVEDGFLELSVIADKSQDEPCEAKSADGKSLGEFPYRVNGHVSTVRTYQFKYGVASARMKFQEEQGQHGAFWLWPDHSVPKEEGAEKSGAEVDVAEWFGMGKSGGDMRSYAYWKDGGEKKQKAGGRVEDLDSFLAGKDDSWFKRYHVFTLEWTPDAYTFLIDGKVTMRIDEGISGVEQYLRLSLLASDFELKYVEKPDEELPQSMDVDWVRVWEAPAS